MAEDRARAEEREEVARRRVARLAGALRDAQARGDVVADCDPDALAHFMVASLEGAMLMSRVTQDLTVVQQCASELDRHLALYEVEHRD